MIDVDVDVDVDIVSEGDSSAKDEDYTDSKRPKLQKIESQPSTLSPTEVVQPAAQKTRRPQSRKKARICDFCGVTETPMWRRGPQGKGTLCNACGVKWSLRGRKKSKKGKESPPPLTVATGDTAAVQTNQIVNADLMYPGAFCRPLFNPSGDVPPSVDLECVPRLHFDTTPPLTPSVTSPIAGCYSPTNAVIESSIINSSHILPVTDCNCTVCGTSKSNFKTSEEFRTHCTRCPGKRTVSPTQEFDAAYFQHKREKRKREFESGKKWDSADGVNCNSNKLLGHLPTVVQERVLEEQELDEIKRELGVVKHGIKEEAAIRKDQIEHYETLNMQELTKFREELLSFINAQDSLRNQRFIQIGKEVVSLLRAGTNDISRDLASILQKPSNLSVDFIYEKIKSMERHVMEIQKKMDSSFSQVEAHMSAESRKLEEQVTIKFEEKAHQVSLETNGLKKQAEKHLNYHMMQINQMEEIANAAQARKEPM